MTTLQLAGRWHRPRTDPARPRVLVETTDPSLRISDFSRYGAYGLDVAVCTGPDGLLGGCPVLRGEPCPAVAEADVVLQVRPASLDLAAALGQLHRGVPVVVEGLPPGSGERLPDHCVVLDERASVEHQVELLQRVVPRRRHPAGRQGRV